MFNTTTLGRVIMAAPAVFMIWFFIKRQHRQFILAMVTYLVFVVGYFGATNLRQEQVAKSENIVTDFKHCIDSDNTKTWDDVSDCYHYMLSDKALYDREYNGKE